MLFIWIVVCKQWYLASQESWRDLKKLDVDKAKWQHGNLKEFKRIEIIEFQTVLERCGSYLTEIDFTYYCTKADSDMLILSGIATIHDYIFISRIENRTFEVIEALASNCTRIEKLSLCSSIINCNDEHLYRLFRRNEKIRYLHLIGYKITGDCFSGLSAEIITTLLIQRCNCVLSEKLHMVSRLILTVIFPMQRK